MSIKSPVSILYDVNGNAVAIQNDSGTYRLRTETKVSESVLPTGAATQATLATLATESKLEAVRLLLADLDSTDFATQATLAEVDTKLGIIDTVLDSIKDTDGIKKITDALPTGDNTIGRTKLTDGTLVASLIADATAALNRLAIEGKVSVVPSVAPSAATAVTLASDTPLTINGTSESAYVIPDGETFHLQTISAGSQGDPTEAGSKVEVIFDENGTEKLIARLYVTGFTVVQSYNDISQARDETALVGNAGGTNRIIIRRIRLSGATQEVDAELRGYVQ